MEIAARSRRYVSTSIAVSNLRPLPLRENTFVMLILVKWVVSLKLEAEAPKYRGTNVVQPQLVSGYL